MRISDWSSDVCSSELVADLVRAMPPHAGLNDTKARLSAGIARLKEGLDELLRDHSRTQAEALRARLIEASAPAALVERIVALSALDGAVGIADLSASLGRTHDEMALANAYALIGEALGVDGAKGAALALDPADPWERPLVAGLVRAFEQFRLGLLRRITSADRAPQSAVQARPRSEEHTSELHA